MKQLNAGEKGKEILGLKMCHSCVRIISVRYTAAGRKHNSVQRNLRMENDGKKRENRFLSVKYLVLRYDYVLSVYLNLVSHLNSLKEKL